ncbi:MAG: hypothetical protein K2Y05_05650 [Hyphomicrobiaceae bacterium]|nr:hypothetical protein [Hyphomicrobiaceae bacterium]
MRWEDDNDYIAHAKCISKRDYGGAIKHLQNVLDRSIATRNDPEQVGFLLYSIGKARFFEGRTRSARYYFAKADRMSGQAALTRLLIAKFYLELANAPGLGVVWLKKAISESQGFIGRFDDRWRKEAQMLLDQAVSKRQP